MPTLTTSGLMLRPAMLSRWDPDLRSAALGYCLRSRARELGFRCEGTVREDGVVDGVVDGVATDSWVYGLLRREWSAP